MVRAKRVIRKPNGPQRGKHIITNPRRPGRSAQGAQGARSAQIAQARNKKNNGPNKRPRRRNNGAKKQPTSEELNSQLDKYMGEEAAKSYLNSQLDAYFSRRPPPMEEEV